MTEPVAVSAEGRITSGCAGLYDEGQEKVWKQVVTAVHQESTALIGVQLNHAGRRGATQPRQSGLDRPLKEGAWPLLAPSPLAYSRYNQVPRQMKRKDMEQVCDEYVRATGMAAKAGFDLLQVHCAQGYLLGSFISPLTNQRKDKYGGSLKNRLRFPLEVYAAVRQAWPEGKPLAATIPATDWAKDGLTVEDAVEVAKAFKDHGCDLIEVLAGGTIPNDQPTYGAGFLTDYCDQIRHEAGVATMVRGYLTTSGQVNSILAGGRADLCVMVKPDGDDG
jgi:anthraniloyl-CoA monooxygenase